MGTRYGDLTDPPGPSTPGGESTVRVAPPDTADMDRFHGVVGEKDYDKQIEDYDKQIREVRRQIEALEEKERKNQSAWEERKKEMALTKSQKRMVEKAAEEALGMAEGAMAKGKIRDKGKNPAPGEDVRGVRPRQRGKTSVRVDSTQDRRTAFKENAAKVRENHKRIRDILGGMDVDVDMSGPGIATGAEEEAARRTLRLGPAPTPRVGMRVQTSMRQAQARTSTIEPEIPPLTDANSNHRSQSFYMAPTVPASANRTINIGGGAPKRKRKTACCIECSDGRACASGSKPNKKSRKSSSKKKAVKTNKKKKKKKKAAKKKKKAK